MSQDPGNKANKKPVKYVELDRDDSLNQKPSIDNNNQGTTIIKLKEGDNTPIPQSSLKTNDVNFSIQNDNSSNNNNESKNNDTKNNNNNNNGNNKKSNKNMNKSNTDSDSEDSEDSGYKRPSLRNKSSAIKKPNDPTICWTCQKEAITYEMLPCGCAIACKKCAMKKATGGKCRKCGEWFTECRKIGTSKVCVK